ncbi:MAG: metallophosphoesterase family protein [bacterium]
MHLAILSDIHSNLEALTTAFEIIDTRSVDEVICLGDVVGYGANPNECLNLVRSRCSTILLGNHDLAAIDLSVTEQFTMNARIAAVWTNRQLTAEHKQFLETLPLTHSREDILFVHASPCNPEEWDYIFSDVDARRAFRHFSEEICFIGHSHTPEVFSESRQSNVVSRGDRYLVNVGSVGQPRDRNPLLSFGLFDTTSWVYEQIRADFDRAAAAEKILNAELPPLLAHRLFSGT